MNQDVTAYSLSPYRILLPNMMQNQYCGNCPRCSASLARHASVCGAQALERARMQTTDDPGLASLVHLVLVCLKSLCLDVQSISLL